MRGLLDQVEARWLAAVNEVVVSGEAEAEAAAGVSITDCLAEQTRRTRSEVRGWVNVAKRLDATSLIAERVADGRLSLGQALVLVRGRTKRTAAFFDEHEAFLVDTAGVLSTDQLQVFMSQWYRRADAATADVDDRDVAARRELFLAPVGSTEWVVRGTLTAEQGDVLNVALTAIAQADWGGAGDERPLPQRRVDALAWLSRFWLDNQQSVTVHGQRPHVAVHIDAADLAQLSGSLLGGVTESGVTVDAKTVERLLCDCVLTRVLVSGSVVLDAGRPSRSIPHGVRRAVIARDRHCRYPACDRLAAWADVHHVREWRHGGGHSLDNCVLLCGRHHDRVHRLAEHIMLAEDGTVEVTAGGVTRMSRPPPNPGRLFAASGRSQQRDPARRQRERDAVTAALGALQRAVEWTDERHEEFENMIENLRIRIPRVA